MSWNAPNATTIHTRPLSPFHRWPQTSQDKTIAAENNLAHESCHVPIQVHCQSKVSLFQILISIFENHGGFSRSYIQVVDKLGRTRPPLLNHHPRLLIAYADDTEIATTSLPFISLEKHRDHYKAVNYDVIPYAASSSSLVSNDCSLMHLDLLPSCVGLSMGIARRLWST